jgi:hypothetical protein
MNRDPIAHEVLNAVVLVTMAFVTAQVLARLGVLISFRTLVVVVLFTRASVVSYKHLSRSLVYDLRPKNHLRRLWISVICVALIVILGMFETRSESARAVEAFLSLGVLIGAIWLLLRERPSSSR